MNNQNGYKTYEEKYGAKTKASTRDQRRPDRYTRIRSPREPEERYRKNRRSHKRHLEASLWRHCIWPSLCNEALVSWVEYDKVLKKGVTNPIIYYVTMRLLTSTQARPAPTETGKRHAPDAPAEK